MEAFFYDHSVICKDASRCSCSGAVNSRLQPTKQPPRNYSQAINGLDSQFDGYDHLPKLRKIASNKEVCFQDGALLSFVFKLCQHRQYFCR